MARFGNEGKKCLHNLWEVRVKVSNRYFVLLIIILREKSLSKNNEGKEITKKSRVNRRGYFIEREHLRQKLAGEVGKEWAGVMKELKSQRLRKKWGFLRQETLVP